MRVIAPTPRLARLPPPRMLAGADTVVDTLLASTTVIADGSTAIGATADELAGSLFGASLFPWLAMLYWLKHPTVAAPPGVSFGLTYLLAFVFGSIPAAIGAGGLYGVSLADSDWLHGAAESLLAITNCVVVLGFRDALAGGATTSADDAGTERLRTAATALGGSLVAKIASQDIAHKSDIGGVRLRLDSPDAVATAYREIMDAAQAAHPQARLDGVLLSPMEGDGVECIVGVQRDPAFGPVVMLGLGGVFVEVLGDVSFRTAPLTTAMAMTMVDELRGRDLLFGARGRPKADVAALADLLVRVSEFAVAAGDSLESLDINPVLVRPDGQGAVALDALIIGREDDRAMNNEENP